MKKFACFCLALCLSAAPAQAVDLKVSGFWDMSFTWANTTFVKENNNDRFMPAQRLRTKVDFISSEYLRGVLQLEMDSNWGTADYQGWSGGGALGTDGKYVKVKSSYIDYRIPNTEIDVRMGLQPVTLPGFVAGSNVFDDDVAGLSVSARINDNIGVTVAWSRPFNDNNLAGVKNARDAADSVTLIVPFTYDTVKIIPWATYAVGGRDMDGFRIRQNGEIVGYGAPQLLPAVWGKDVDWAKGNSAQVVWAGLTGEFTMYDPLRLAFDFNYGNLDGVASQLDRAGWFLSALAEYKFEGVTPGIMAWYGSGDDGNINNGSERMPTFSAGWTGTAMGWENYYSSRGDGAAIIGGENVGNWGVALYAKDISCTEKLSHSILVARYQGTNSSSMARYISGAHAGNYAGFGTRSWETHTTNGLYLTKDDSVWEVNVNSLYSIYENLEFSLELGYMNLDLDKASWGINSYERNAYRVDATIRYSF